MRTCTLRTCLLAVGLVLAVSGRRACAGLALPDFATDPGLTLLGDAAVTGGGQVAGDGMAQHCVTSWTLVVYPEPSTLVLLGLGGLAALRRRRRRVTSRPLRNRRAEMRRSQVRALRGLLLSVAMIGLLVRRRRRGGCTTLEGRSSSC